MTSAYPPAPPPPSSPATDSDVLGRRIGAALIDSLVLFLLFVLLGILIGDSSSGDGNVSVNLSGGPFLIWLLVTLGYYFGTEATSGQTIGKRVTRIRVVSVDGSRASAGQIAGRTALRLIDGIFFYLVGLITILATGQRRQRIGDMAGRTKVVAA